MSTGLLIAGTVLVGAAQLAGLRAEAMEVRTIEVKRAGTRYVVQFEASLDAPAEQVGAVLTDYEHYPQLDARILESRLEKSDSTKLYTRLRGCLGSLLCRTLRRVERIDQTSDSLTATALPGDSDVKFGSTHSAWHASGAGTQVQYRLEIEPDFWVPPLFGPRMMIKTLREGTLNLFRNVERAANERSQAPEHAQERGREREDEHEPE